MLFQRDAALVLREPCIERLQFRVQGSGDIESARAAEDLFKIALELEHVAEVFGAGKAEFAIRLGRHVVVVHLSPQRLGERGGHLRAGQVLARNADGLADILLALLEDAEGALADVFRGDAGKFLVAHGKGERQLAVGAFLRAHAEVNHVVPVERGQQKRRRHAELGEHLVGLAFQLSFLNRCDEDERALVREYYQRSMGQELAEDRQDPGKR